MVEKFQFFCHNFRIKMRSTKCPSYYRTEKIISLIIAQSSKTNKYMKSEIYTRKEKRKKKAEE